MIISKLEEPTEAPDRFHAGDVWEWIDAPKLPPKFIEAPHEFAGSTYQFKFSASATEYLRFKDGKLQQLFAYHSDSSVRTLADYVCWHDVPGQ